MLVMPSPSPAAAWQQTAMLSDTGWHDFFLNLNLPEP
jgi:hypothetical protein